MNIRGSSTGIRGVHFKAGKFRAVGYHDRQPIYLGTFDRMDEAKKAYDKWKELPKPVVRQEKRPNDHHKNERVSVEIMNIVDSAFLPCIKNSRVKINAGFKINRLS